MANVQLENGFTRIANDIFEQMAKTKLSPIQYRILFVIWRYTYGFNRKEHEFSLSFIGTATEYDQRQLQRELIKLEQRKIIVQKVKRGKPRIISFNKNHDEWLESEAIGSSTIGNSTKGTIGKVTKGTIGNSTKEERKNLKKNIKKDAYEMNKNPFKEYENNFGLLSSSVINKFNYWLDDSQFTNPEEIICEVITRAKANEAKHPMQYIDKILLDHHKNNRLTLDAVKANHNEFDSKVKRKAAKSLDWKALKEGMDDE